ncbi:MAG: cysteine hydrolase [Chloroflexota bacterium]|nr:cysteine hydrolase [Chloroflexota bacterium]
MISAIDTMNIPHSNRKRALFVIDVQPAFVLPEGEFALTNIQKLINSMPYDLYVESLFYCDEDSMWGKQTDERLHPRDEGFQTLPLIRTLLENHPCVRVEKHTKSAFKGDRDLVAILRQQSIEEIHIVGYDTDDCVFATASEAFDLGYFTYVIEECTSSGSGNEMRERALAILRNVCLTNNSCVEKINILEV